MFNAARSMGEWTLAVLETLGRASVFLAQTLLGMGAAVRRFSLVIKQVYASGVRTLSIVLVSGLFVGMVLALQGYNTLVQFGAEESLGVVVALTLVRELGPVVAGLLFAGRAGSALTAEIGLMKSTEQLSGLEMMAVDPFQRIFAPRLLAGFLALPMLAAMFTAVGVLGGHLVAVDLLSVDAGVFWSRMQGAVGFYTDVLSGLLKAVVFGFVVTWIAIFEGWDCVPTPEGVANATTRTVVKSSLAVLGLDFVMTAVMFTV